MTTRHALRRIGAGFAFALMGTAAMAKPDPTSLWYDARGVRLP